MTAKPNHDRKETYEPPKTPKPVQEEKQNLPVTARENVREKMPRAADAVKKRA